MGNNLDKLGVRYQDHNIELCSDRLKGKTCSCVSAGEFGILAGHNLFHGMHVPTQERCLDESRNSARPWPCELVWEPGKVKNCTAWSQTLRFINSTCRI
ncbi:MAG: hypothetical protein CMJ21_07090 [Phycisphaerae bacterium]|nr:hypothetical protein [Phycisphaerae bacterium]